MCPSFELLGSKGSSGVEIEGACAIGRDRGGRSMVGKNQKAAVPRHSNSLAEEKAKAKWLPIIPTLQRAIERTREGKEKAERTREQDGRLVATCSRRATASAARQIGGQGAAPASIASIASSHSGRGRIVEEIRDQRPEACRIQVKTNHGWRWRSTPSVLPPSWTIKMVDIVSTWDGKLRPSNDDIQSAGGAGRSRPLPLGGGL